MRVTLQPSYILHSRPYRDSSVLLDVLTAEYGRVGLLARGARRQSRKGSRGALLQAFTPLLLSFSGRSELKNLGATETAGVAFSLRGEALYSAMYVNELLVRLLHRNDAHPRLFASYSTVLQELVSMQSLDSALRQFELALLDELGYTLDLACDGASGDAIEAAGHYAFEPGSGLVARDIHGRQTTHCYRGVDLLAMAAGDFDGEARLPARRLLKAVLAIHLGDQPVKSRDLFRGSSNRYGGKGRYGELM